MSNPRSTKRQRERDRQERAERKRQRRVDREETAGVETEAVSNLPQEQVLERLAELHQRFADEKIGLDEFETARDELTGQLHVD